MKYFLISLVMLSTCHLFLQPLLRHAFSPRESSTECSCENEPVLHSQLFDSGLTMTSDSENTLNERDRVFAIVRETYSSATNLWVAKEALRLRRARKFRRSVQRPEHEEVASEKEAHSEERPVLTEEGKIKFS